MEPKPKEVARATRGFQRERMTMARQMKPRPAEMDSVKVPTEPRVRDAPAMPARKPQNI